MHSIPSPLSGVRGPWGGRRAFNPASLFGASDVGGIWDASVLTSLFQDGAGTTPVTAAGQPVGKMLDLSGKGNHYTQSVSASRPTYQVDGNGRKYLAFDGVDGGMLTGTITPAGGADKAQVFAGVRKLIDSPPGIVLEYSANSASNAGTFYLSAGNDAGAIGASVNGYSSLARGSAAAVLTQSGQVAVAAPDTAVISVTHDIAGDLSVLRRNGVNGTNGTGDKGTGIFGTYPLYMGRRGGASIPLNGNMYAHIVRIASTNLTAAQISAAEAWINYRTGAY